MCDIFLCCVPFTVYMGEPKCIGVAAAATAVAVVGAGDGGAADVSILTFFFQNKIDNKLMFTTNYG